MSVSAKGLAALVALAGWALAPSVARAQDAEDDPLGGDRSRWYRADELYVETTDDEWQVALQGDVRVIVGDALLLADGAVVWFKPGQKGEDEGEGEDAATAADPTKKSPFRAIYAEGHVRISLYGAVFEASAVMWDVERGEVRLWMGVIAVPPGITRAALDPQERERILAGFGTRGAQAATGQTVNEGVPAVVLRADRARIADFMATGGKKSGFDIGTIEAYGLLITTCSYGDPHWSVTTERSTITREAAAAPDPDPDAGAAQPPPEPEGPRGGSDRAVKLEVEATRGDRVIENEGGRINVDLELLPKISLPVPGVPPFSYFNTAWLPFLPRLRVGSSGEFGPFVLTDWRTPQVTFSGYGQSARGRGTVELDYYADRGPATGLDFVVSSWGKLGTFDTLVDSYYVHDHGEDIQGMNVPHHDRGRVVLLHRHRDLPLGILVDGELHYLSDDGFLNEYFERESKTEKPPETYVHARRNDESHAVQLTARFRLNRFDADNLGGVTYTEQLPRLVYQLMPTPVWSEPALGGSFYISSRIELANLRKRVRLARPSRFLPGTVPTFAAGSDDQERSARADGLAELTYANSFGPLRLRADVGGRLTLYQRRLLVDDGKNRLTLVGNTLINNERRHGLFVDAIDRTVGFARVSLSTDIWRAWRYENESLDWHGVRHVFTPTIGYENFYHVSEDPEELIQFDRIDQVRETEFFFVNLRNRIQTRRLDGVLDVVDLELEGRYFPHASNEFTRRTFDLVSADLRLRPDRWIVGRIKADYDPDDGRLRQSDASIGVSLFDRMRLTVTHSWVDEDARGVVANGPVPTSFFLFGGAQTFDRGTSAIGYDLAAQLTDKWSLRLLQQYDLDQGNFIQQRITLRRRLHSFILDFNFSIDGGEDDDVSFSVTFMPEWLLGRGDAFGTDSRVSDLSY